MDVGGRAATHWNGSRRLVSAPHLLFLHRATSRSGCHTLRMTAAYALRLISPPAYTARAHCTVRDLRYVYPCIPHARWHAPRTHHAPPHASTATPTTAGTTGRGRAFGRRLLSHAVTRNSARWYAPRARRAPPNARHAADRGCSMLFILPLSTPGPRVCMPAVPTLEETWMSNILLRATVAGAAHNNLYQNTVPSHAWRPACCLPLHHGGTH